MVYIASSIVINDNFSLLKFMNPFFYLPVFPKPNNTNHFQFINIL